jgi:RHS repeat-associated protein
LWGLLLAAIAAAGLGYLPVSASAEPPSPGERRLSPLAAARFEGMLDAWADGLTEQSDPVPSDEVPPHRASGVQIDGPGFVPPDHVIESVTNVGRDATPVRELPEERSAYSEVIENADGSRTVRAFTTPKYFETLDGSFALVDNAVIRDDSRTGWLRNTAGAWAVRFGPLLPDGTGGVELRKGDVALRFYPDFAQIPVGGITPEVGEDDATDTVTYRNVAPGVDLEYVVTGTGVKENVVINAPVESTEFAFRVHGASLTQVIGAPDGTLGPGGRDPESSFVITSPLVVDGRGISAQNTDAKPVSRVEAVESMDAESSSRVVVGLDSSWLNSLDESDFPVRLDPTVTDYGGDRKVFTSPGPTYLNAFNEVFAGNWYLGSNNYFRSFLQFVDYDAAFGGTVTNAEIDMVDAGNGDNQSSTVWVHEADSGVHSSWGWTTFNATAEDSETFTTAGTLNVTSMVQDWVSNSLADQAVLFKGQETSGAFTRKSFDATLEVTYVTNVAPPAATTNPQPPNHGVLLADEPTLSVDPVVDPDMGDTVQYRFTIDDDPDFSSPEETSSWQSSNEYTVTSGLFSIVQDYYWRVESRDNHGNTTTPTSGFRLSPTAIGYDALSGYFRGLNTLTGNFIFTETDASVASVGPKMDLSRTFNAFDTHVGPFGKGWSSSYFMRWFTVGGDVVVQYPDGRREIHQPDGVGGWNPPAGYTAELAGPHPSGPNTGGYTLTMQTGDAYEFDDSTTGGRLISIADPVGRTASVDYSNIGSGEVVIRDETTLREITLTVTGTITDFVVDAASIPNPAGGTFDWTYTYDDTYGDQRLIEACDARGTTGFCKEYTWEAEADGRLTHVYDRKGQLDSLIDYSDVTGRIVEVTDADANTTGYSYYQDGAGPFSIEVEMTDANNETWLHEYEGNGDFVDQFVPGVADGWPYTYDPVTRTRTSATDPNGNTSSWAYDSELRPIATTNGEGEKTFTVFDDAGNVAKVCDGRTADANNDDAPDTDTYCSISNYGGTLAERERRLIRSRVAPGRTPELWTYTTGTELAYGSLSDVVPIGLPLTYTDARGKVTLYEYTQQGDLARVSDSGGPNPPAATRYEAESATSNVSTCTAAGGYSGSGYRCDSSPTTGANVNFATVSVPASGLYQITFRYSAPSGTANRQLYLDLSERGTSVPFPATASASDWKTVSLTVPLKSGTNSVKLWFDAAGGSSGALNIDSLDVATRSTGLDTRNTYDVLGRLLTSTEHSDTFPAGAETSYTYNAIGQPVTTTHPAVTNPISAVTHRLKVTNTVDANGNITEVDAEDLTGGDATRHTEHEYDLLDREWRTTDAEGGTVERRFDEVGNVVHTKDPEGRWIRTTYNDRNLPIKTEALGVVGDPDLATPVATLSEIEYDDAGRVTATVDTVGQRVETSYDDANRTFEVIHVDYQDDVGIGADRDVLLGRRTYNDAGLIITLEEGGDPAGAPMRTTYSTYDDAGQLLTTEIDGLDRTATLTRNPAGDVVIASTTQPGVNAGGVGTSETRFAYDSAGRLVCETVENGGTDLITTTTYDSRGIVVGLVPPRGNTSCSSSDASYRTTSVADLIGRTSSTTAPAVSVEANGSGGGTPASTPQRASVGSATQSDGAAVVSGATSSPGELLVVLATYAGWGAPNLSIGDSAGLTWTEQATDIYTNPDSNQVAQTSVFTAVTTGTTTNITVSAGGSPSTYVVKAEVFRYSSHGGIGSVASDSDDINKFQGGPYNISLPVSSTQASSETLAVVGLTEHFSTPLTPGTGWTELTDTDTQHATAGSGHNYTAGATLRHQSQVKGGTLTSASWTYTTGNEYGEAYAAVEILAGTQGVAGFESPTTSTGYNTFGEATHVRDPNGNVRVTEYDELGRQTVITYPSYTPPGGSAIVPTESYQYDAVGNLVEHTSRRGEVTSYEYDIFNHLIEKTDPAVGMGSPGVWTYEYGDLVNLTRQVDPTGAEIQFTYDARNRQRSTTDVVRTKTVTPQIGAPGPQTPQNVTGGSYTTVFEHDDLGRLITTTSHEGVVSEVEYNEAGDVVAATDADNQTTTSTVDVYGNPVRITDPLGRQTRFAYDSAGRAISSGAYANSGASVPIVETLTGYDADGRTVSSTSGEGHVTTFAYDKAGRLTQVVQPLDAFGPATTSYFYDAAGNLTRSRDPRSVAAPPLITEAWDGATSSAWPTKWATAQSASGATDIDANRGRLLTPATSSSYSRALADSTSQHTDAEVTTTIRTGSNTTGSDLASKLWLRGSTSWATAGYNLTDGYNLSLNQSANTVALREVVSSTDSALASTSFTFSADTTYRVRFQAIGSALKAKIWVDGAAEPGSWTLSTTDASLTSGRAAISQQGTATGARTSYVDDYTLRPTSNSASAAYDTITTYNTWNLPESVIEPSTTAHTSAGDRTFTRVYDAGGLPVEDRQPGSVTVSATFDELGRLTAESATGGASRSFGYDLAGRMTTVSHPGGTQSFISDDRGLPIGAAGPAGNTIAAYDGDGRLLTRNDPAGAHAYTYTTQDELHTAADPLTGGMLTYTYDDASQPLQVDYGAGVNHPVRTFGYDDAGRLLVDEMKTGSTSKMKATYTYDDDSNVLTETVENVFASTETSTYTYDRSQRLTSFTRQQSAGTPAMTSYRWDHAGNKVAEGASKTWTYDERNRIAAGPDGTYDWDARGTLDSITAPSTAVTEFAYDGLGRQTQYMTAAVTVDYAYDALDRIATRTRGMTVDAFAYNGGAIDPSKVTTGGNALSYSRNVDGSTIAVNNTGTSATAFTGANKHGDNRWNFDASGGTTDSEVFDPFGNSLASTGSTADNLGFQTDWTDPDSDNVWMGARWYSPASGTFHSRDTYAGELAAPKTLNRYTFGLSNPITYFDPNGNVACIDFGVATGCTQDSCPFGQKMGLTGCYDPAQWCRDKGLSYDVGRDKCLSKADLCARFGQVVAMDGTCVKPWAPGDPCGVNGVRGLDVSICVERQAAGSSCDAGAGVPGLFGIDGLTCVPDACAIAASFGANCEAPPDGNWPGLADEPPNAASLYVPPAEVTSLIHYNQTVVKPFYETLVHPASDNCKDPYQSYSSDYAMACRDAREQLANGDVRGAAESYKDWIYPEPGGQIECPTAVEQAAGFIGVKSYIDAGGEYFRGDSSREQVANDVKWDVASDAVQERVVVELDKSLIPGKHSMPLEGIWTHGPRVAKTVGRIFGVIGTTVATSVEYVCDALDDERAPR